MKRLAGKVDEFFNQLKKFDNELIEVKCDEQGNEYIEATFILDCNAYEKKLQDNKPDADIFDVNINVDDNDIIINDYSDKFEKQLEKLAKKYGYSLVGIEYVDNDKVTFGFSKMNKSAFKMKRLIANENYTI